MDIQPFYGHEFYFQVVTFTCSCFKVLTGPVATLEWVQSTKALTEQKDIWVFKIISIQKKKHNKHKDCEKITSGFKPPL